MSSIVSIGEGDEGRRVNVNAFFVGGEVGGEDAWAASEGEVGEAADIRFSLRVRRVGDVGGDEGRGVEGSRGND